MSTIIDIYCHIYPDRFFQEMSKVAPNLSNIGQRLRGIKKLFDLDARFKEMDEFGDYRQIISLPNPAIEDIAKPDVGLQLARIANDSMAELCRKYPERFPSFAAALCLTDVEGSIKEAQRAIKDLGARGVLVYTNVAGRTARSAEIRAAFQDHGGARSADLAASGRHRRDAGLSGREEVALRDVVVLPLALRNVGGHGAHGVQRAARPLSEIEDHHPPSRRHDPLLRRPRRQRPQGAWASARRTRTIRKSCRR